MQSQSNTSNILQMIERFFGKNHLDKIKIIDNFDQLPEVLKKRLNRKVFDSLNEHHTFFLIYTDNENYLISYSPYSLDISSFYGRFATSKEVEDNLNFHLLDISLKEVLDQLIKRHKENFISPIKPTQSDFMRIIKKILK